MGVEVEGGAVVAVMVAVAARRLQLRAEQGVALARQLRVLPLELPDAESVLYPVVHDGGKGICQRRCRLSSESCCWWR